MLEKTFYKGGRFLPSVDWLEELVDTETAAKLVGLSPATLSTMRSRGGDLFFHKLGRIVRYRRRTLIEWADARRRRNTSDVSVNQNVGETDDVSKT